MYKKLVAAAVLIALNAFPAKAEMPKQINWGILSGETRPALEKEWGQLLREMSKALGVKVKPFFASDYAGIIESIRFDKVDIAFLGAKAAIHAVDRSGGEVFAQTIDGRGRKGYYSILIVHKDSPINSLKDVLKCDKSLTFSNGDPNSTSGFAIPGYYAWALNNVEPDETCFKRVMSSNHEGNIFAVAFKKVDIATANNSALYDRLKKRRPDIAGQVREIWRSPLIPSDPMVWRKNLPQDVKEKILYFFIQLGRFGSAEKVERERKVLMDSHGGLGPFLASSNAQLIDIRRIGLFKKQLKAKKRGDTAAVAKLDEELKKLSELAKVSEKTGF